MDIEKYLDQSMLDSWIAAGANATPVEGAGAPEPAMLVTDAEWIKSIRRLRESNVLGIQEMGEVAKDPVTGLPLLAGVFGLVKRVKNGKIDLRLIIDRRPQNFYEHLVDGLAMPHSSCLTKLALGPNELVRLSLRDASNFYYLLKAPKGRLPYQGLGPAVSRAWWESGCPDWPLDRILLQEGDVVQPTFLAISMGDKNGVVIAETYHRKLMLLEGVFEPDEEILLGAPFPDAKASAGVCIDDLAVFQKLSVHDFKSQTPLRDNVMLSRADEVYKEQGLPEKVAKRTRFQKGGKAWGRGLHNGARGR